MMSYTSVQVEGREALKYIFYIRLEEVIILVYIVGWKVSRNSG